VDERSDEAYKGGGVKSWILADDLLPQLNLGYRGLVVIEREDYWEVLTPLLRSVKEKGNPTSIVYAFHPWKEGAKDRLREIKAIFDGIKDVDYSHSEEVLGSTFDLAILDCADDFRPNYLARIIDTVRGGGGLAVIYSDDLSSPTKLYKSTLAREGEVDSLFEERFRRLAKSKEGIAYVGEEAKFRPYLREPKEAVWTNYKGVKVTEDQAKVIKEADFLFHSDEPRAYVITAPRGRGKSYAAGVLLGDLLKRMENFRAVVTSPTLLNAQEVFKGASSVRGVTLLKSKSGEAKGVRRGSSVAEWLPPEMASYSEGDLIVVDEFAAIPNEILDEILRKWKKVVLTSTTFGYEGSGKAFKKLMERVKGTHLVKHTTMETPIRYPPGDPVEAFLNDAFLLKPTTATVKSGDGVREVSREELANSEALLRSVYSVLLTAHYRNSPDDLMFLLDMKFQRVLAEIRNGQVLGVAELVYEGGLSEREVERLYKGEENAGHLIPHRIIKFLGVKEFGNLKGFRVMRIAVAEEEQGKGHGSELLRRAEELAVAEGLDWIGSSFVSDYRVLRFWLKNGFTPVHIASRGNEALSGFSIVVLKGLNELAEKLVQRLARRLKEKLVLTSHQVYYKLSPLVLASLLKGTPPIQWRLELGEEDLTAIQRYFDGDLPYNAVADSFHKLLLKALGSDLKLNDEDLAVVVARALQGKSWSQIAVSLGLGGSNNAEKAFREASYKLFKALFRHE
jgi:tRNA(Met) cytidine acetyltransferase